MDERGETWSETGLRRAVRHGDDEAVARALATDPEATHATSTRGGTLLLEAHERELPGIADAFLSGRDARDGAPELDIHEAASLGRPGVVLRILTSEPQAFGERGPDGFFPIHRAAYRGHAEVVRLLLDAGSPLDLRTDNGARLTPLESVAAGRARFGPSAGYDAVEGLLTQLG